MSVINKKMFLRLFPGILMSHYREEVFLADFLKRAFSNDFSTNKRLGRSLHVERLKELVTKNKLANLILAFTNKEDSFNFPSNLIAELKKNDLVARLVMKSHRLNSDNVFNVLTRSGCDFIVMKTYLFKKTLFDGKEVKVASDLDIFIKPYEFNKVYDVLIKNGFSYIPDARRMTESRVIDDISFFTPSSQETFVKSGFCVEIHTSLIDEHNLAHLGDEYRNLGSQINMRLYSGTMSIINHGLSIKVFKPTELFLSLFLHTFFQHNFDGPLAYYEAAKVLKKLRINWNYINKFIKDFGLEVFFNWYLLLLSNLFPTALDKKITTRVKKLKHHLSFSQSLLFGILTYKMFGPTNFLKYQDKEIFKELTWSIISGRLGFFTRQIVKRGMVNAVRYFVRYR